MHKTVINVINVNTVKVPRMSRKSLFCPDYQECHYSYRISLALQACFQPKHLADYSISNIQTCPELGPVAVPACCYFCCLIWRPNFKLVNFTQSDTFILILTSHVLNHRVKHPWHLRIAITNCMSPPWWVCWDWPQNIENTSFCFVQTILVSKLLFSHCFH